MVNITIRNFTGKSFSLDVDLESSVATLKEAIANAKPTGNNQLWQIETHLTFNGYELRDHRALSYYGIVQGNTLRIVPPTLKKRVKLNFERDSDPEKKFVLFVDANLTVAQLKKEISFEERIEVTQLKYFAISEENADDVVVSTLQELRDDHLISSYPLEDEVITVYTEIYYISVTSGDAQATFRFEPSKTVGRLKEFLAGHPMFPRSENLCLMWNNEQLSEGKTLAQYKIPSEAHLTLELPTTFFVELAIEGFQDRKKMEVKVGETLADFKASIPANYIDKASISEMVFILVGHELVGESTTLKDLGFVPWCIIHAVKFVSVKILSWFGSYETMTFHPLTRLSVLREKLEGETEPRLSRFWFTLDGECRLKESRTLWDLNITNDSTIHLRPCTLSLMIRVIPRKSIFETGTTYQVEAEEDESVWGLKERIQLLTGIPLTDQRLIIRGKIREDNKTLKQLGLVGGETLQLLPYPGQPLPGEGHQSDDDEIVYPTGDEAEGSGINRDMDEVEGESAPSYEFAMEDSLVHV